MWPHHCPPHLTNAGAATETCKNAIAQAQSDELQPLDRIFHANVQAHLPTDRTNTIQKAVHSNKVSTRKLKYCSYYRICDFCKYSLLTKSQYNHEIVIRLTNK
jgi:hypothetical protein